MYFLDCFGKNTKQPIGTEHIGILADLQTDNFKRLYDLTFI